MIFFAVRLCRDIDWCEEATAECKAMQPIGSRASMPFCSFLAIYREFGSTRLDAVNADRALLGLSPLTELPFANQGATDGGSD